VDMIVARTYRNEDNKTGQKREIARLPTIRGGPAKSSKRL